MLSNEAYLEKRRKVMIEMEKKDNYSLLEYFERLVSNRPESDEYDEKEELHMIYYTEAFREIKNRMAKGGKCSNEAV